MFEHHRSAGLPSSNWTTPAHRSVFFDRGSRSVHASLTPKARFAAIGGRNNVQTVKARDFEFSRYAP